MKMNYYLQRYERKGERLECTETLISDIDEEEETGNERKDMRPDRHTELSRHQLRANGSSAGEPRHAAPHKTQAPGK